MRPGGPVGQRFPGPPAAQHPSTHRTLGLRARSGNRLHLGQHPVLFGVHLRPPINAAAGIAWMEERNKDWIHDLAITTRGSRPKPLLALLAAPDLGRQVDSGIGVATPYVNGRGKMTASLCAALLLLFGAGAGAVAPAPPQTARPRLSWLEAAALAANGSLPETGTALELWGWWTGAAGALGPPDGARPAFGCLANAFASRLQDRRVYRCGHARAPRWHRCGRPAARRRARRPARRRAPRFPLIWLRN